MEILNEFGFNPILFIAQVVNFLIILYVLKRFMFKPVLSMLKKREEEIRNGIDASAKASLELEKAYEKEKEILIKAKKTAQEIIDLATNDSLKLKEDAKASAKDEAEKILLTARMTIEDETKKAENNLQDKINIIAVNVLRKSLSGTIDDKQQQAIINNAIKKIKI